MSTLTIPVDAEVERAQRRDRLRAEAHALADDPADVTAARELAAQADRH